MDKRRQNILFLLLLLIYGSLIVVNPSLNTQPFSKTGSLEKHIPKTSFLWNLTGTPIYVDGSASGVSAHNWSWVETQEWFGGGIGSQNDPYIFENITINGQNSSYCVKIINSNVHFIIRNCEFFNSGNNNSFYAGIDLNHVHNGSIIDNHLYNHHTPPIRLHSSSNNTIKGNLIEKNYVFNVGAIDLGYNSEENLILNNKIHNNDLWGIRLAYDSPNNTIRANEILNNSVAIDLSDSCDNTKILENTIYACSLGIQISTSGTLIQNNDIRNSERGIFIGDSFENNVITRNVISENNDWWHGYAIQLWLYTKNNLIYENFIFREGEKYVLDEGINNWWNNSQIGNYYDNYEGEDSNKDGIGDIEHFIQGGNYDYLPIFDDESPNITIIEPIANVVYNNTAPEFHVKTTDRYLYKTWYTLNRDSTKYHFTSNSSIDQSAWETLPEGEIILRFYAMDRADQVSMKEIIIYKGKKPSIVIGSSSIGMTLVPIIISIIVIYLYIEKHNKI